MVRGPRAHLDRDPARRGRMARVGAGKIGSRDRGEGRRAPSRRPTDGEAGSDEDPLLPRRERYAGRTRPHRGRPGGATATEGPAPQAAAHRARRSDCEGLARGAPEAEATWHVRCVDLFELSGRLRARGRKGDTAHTCPVGRARCRRSPRARRIAVQACEASEESGGGAQETIGRMLRNAGVRRGRKRREQSHPTRERGRTEYAPEPGRPLLPASPRLSSRRAGRRVQRRRTDTHVPRAGRATAGSRTPDRAPRHRGPDSLLLLPRADVHRGLRPPGAPRGGGSGTDARGAARARRCVDPREHLRQEEGAGDGGGTKGAAGSRP